MVQTLAKSFTAVGLGGAIGIREGKSLDYAVSGTFVGTVKITYSPNGTSWSPILTISAAASGRLEKLPAGQYRFECTAFTSGTIVTSVATVADTIREFKSNDGTTLLKITEDSVENLKRTSQVMNISAGGLSKVGATSGWVVGAADNISLVTCPAAQTASTLVVRVPNLKVGSIITGFNLVGQIESGGNTATVDANLRVMTAAAADVVDASVDSITQLSVTADSIMSSANAGKTLTTPKTVGADENYYVLITATTAAATDIALQGIQITYTEV